MIVSLSLRNRIVCRPGNSKLYLKNSEPSCNSFHCLEIIQRWENSQDLCGRPARTYGEGELRHYQEL